MMWEKPSNFEELREAYLEAKQRTDFLAGIRAMRKISPMSIAEAKNVMCWIEDGCDIVEAQGRLLDSLTSLESDNNDERKRNEN